jgi:hypothetical protein
LRNLPLWVFASVPKERKVIHKHYSFPELVYFYQQMTHPNYIKSVIPACDVNFCNEQIYGMNDFSST